MPVCERILQLYDDGDSPAEIAELLGYWSPPCGGRASSFRRVAPLQPQTHWCGRKTLLTQRRQTRLQKLVAARPDATLAELGFRLDRPFRTSTVD